jgi:hypothetical protein
MTNEDMATAKSLHEGIDSAVSKLAKLVATSPAISADISDAVRDLQTISGYIDAWLSTIE